MIISRPLTMPMPLTIPAPGTSPPYSVLAASVESSRNGVPGSSNNSMRARAARRPLPLFECAGQAAIVLAVESELLGGGIDLAFDTAHASSPRLRQQRQERRAALERLPNADMDGGDG